MTSNDLLERFRTDLRALTAAEGRVGIAVSGGADSLALLLLAAKALPGRGAPAAGADNKTAGAAGEGGVVAPWVAERSV